jgi:hypothetical protein
MKNKLLAVLSTVCVAVVCTVTTVSITLWAVNENKKDVNADGSISVNISTDGGNISGTMSAGVQANGQMKTVSGVVNGEAVADISAAQNIKNISSVDIGDIELTIEANKDGYVNVWFEITNLSDAKLNVAATLYSGAGAGDTNIWEDTSNITAEIFFAPLAVACLLSKINIAESAIGTITNADDNDIEEYNEFSNSVELSAEEYYEKFSIEKSNTAGIAKDKTTVLVVRYSVSNAKENIAKLFVTLALTFSL